MIADLFSRRKLVRLGFPGRIACLAGMLMLPLCAGESQTAVDPKADAVLQPRGGFLTVAPFFAVTADVWQDSNLASGQRVQSNRSVELKVRRPDRFHSEARFATRNRALYYDGTSLTLVNRTQQFFGAVAARATLAAALDLANERFRIAPSGRSARFRSLPECHRKNNFRNRSGSGVRSGCRLRTPRVSAGRHGLVDLDCIGGLTGSAPDGYHLPR